MTLHLAKEDVGAGAPAFETKAIALPGEGEEAPMALTAPPEDWRPPVEGGGAQSLRERVNRAGAAVWASFGRSSAAPFAATDEADQEADEEVEAAAVDAAGGRGPGAAGGPAKPAWKKKAALFAGASLIAVLVAGAFVAGPILFADPHATQKQVAETGVGTGSQDQQVLIAPSAEMARVERPEAAAASASKPAPAAGGPDALAEILALKPLEKGAAPILTPGAAEVVAPPAGAPAQSAPTPQPKPSGAAAGIESATPAGQRPAADKAADPAKAKAIEKPVAAEAKPAAPAPEAAAAAPAPVAAERYASPAADVRVASVWADQPAATVASEPAAKAAAADDGKNERTALALVTELGALLHDVRAEVAGLKAAEHASAAATEARLSDFERRLSLGEARRAIDSVKAVGDDSADATDAIAPTAAIAAPKPAGTPGKAQKGNRAKAAVATASAIAPDPDARKRYRVQAASPTLAMLAEIDRSGDDGAPLQIGIGADVPGYGKVKSIAQRGTSWVVETESGSIQ